MAALPAVLYGATGQLSLGEHRFPCRAYVLFFAIVAFLGIFPARPPCLFCVPPLSGSAPLESPRTGRGDHDGRADLGRETSDFGRTGQE